MTISSGSFNVGTGQTSPHYATWAAAAADIVDLTGTLTLTAVVAEDFNKIILSGFATTAANKLILKVDPSVMHDGTPGSGHRIWSTSSGGFGAIEFSSGIMHVEVHGFEVAMEATNSYSWRQTGSTASVNGDIRFYDCLFYGDRDGDTTLFNQVIRMNGTYSHFDTIEFHNCGAFQYDNAAWTGDSSGSDLVKCYNCTAVKVTTWVTDVSTSFRNCLAVNCIGFNAGNGSGWYNFMGLAAASSNNASTDTTGNITGLTPVSDYIVSLGTAFDLHLAATATELIAAGTPITGVTLDFEGDTRHATTPDIGWDEFASAGGGTPSYLNLPLLGVG